MHAFTNQQVAKILRELAAVLEARNENFFKIRAYRNAADVVEGLDQSLYTLWQAGNMSDVAGIGPAITDKLTDLFSTGKSDEINQIKSKVPQGMFALLELEGVGAKKAYKLAENFKLTSADTALDELEKLIKSDQIAQLPGFGQKSQAELASTLQRYRHRDTSRWRIDKVDIISTNIIAYLKTSKLVDQVSALGSLRRRKSTIGDIDIGLTTDNPDKVVQHILTFSEIKQIIAQGDQLVRFIHNQDINVDIKILDASAWGSLLQHFTGSKQHNVALREYALKKDLSLSEHGIKTKTGILKFTDEKKFYNYLGLTWIPPEIRENNGEIEAALKNKLPKLIEVTQIKGDLHTHTNYQWPSSHDYGANSMNELVEAAVKKKYAYIALGDHNPSTAKQSDETITKLVQKRTQKVGEVKVKFDDQIKVLNTLEVDILPSGELALPKEACEILDLVIVSIHSSFNLPRKAQTERVLKALTYPNVKVLAHPTGRLINKRDGYDLDWERIFTYCSEHHIAVEINANPSRLDLNETLVRQALEAEVKLVINSDAHDISHLDFVSYGIDVARRGWVSAADVVNTYSREVFEQWLER